MQKWIGIGNLTKDIELEKTSNGLAVAKFSIAIPDSFSKEKETDFINCVAWRGQAENLAKYCKKGDKICVTGKIKPRTYEAQDGTKRYVTEVICEEIEFLNTKRDGLTAEQKKDLTPIDTEELPF